MCSVWPVRLLYPVCTYVEYEVDDFSRRCQSCVASLGAKRLSIFTLFNEFPVRRITPPYVR